MNKSEATGWIPIGPHFIRFEAPDLIHTRASGTLTGPEAVETWKLAQQWSKDTDDLYWIADISQFEHYSGAAVKAARIHGQEPGKKMRCVVCVGGNYRQRTAISILIKVLGLLPIATNIPEFVFVDSVDEARLIIDQLRQRRALRTLLPG